ncbi:CobW family GTP-binding protein [Fluviispira multicolorata]|uniref:GTP-binding protein n=1 Tax=Fluviispira multicolorata TaxID=2654512 RepID=A0A833N329_9BACT|nr:GTP-binding protein [Fluviispira multicolorata]KAB8033473.1 GTP-binding protein [Fluviispira multicolorata]
MSQKEYPVTVVTGFLGSGKTTLLNRMLSENHGKKIAVILNEIGDVNLDSELVIQSIGEELKIMNNGCVCCTVRGDLTKICLDLITKKINFDHVVIETTGMADPSPVAQTFFMDENLRKHFYLDAVVTVVDAKHIDQNLSEIKETQDQIGFADVILLNKIDTITETQIVDVEKKIKNINSIAKLFKTINSNIKIEEILGINAFDLQARTELNPDITKEYHEHNHDDAIQSIYLEETRPLDMERLNRFMQLVISELGNQVLRYKGILNIKDEPNRIVFQGVHTTMGSNEDRAWEASEERKTRMVFIGRHLPKEVLEEGLSLCVAKL